MQLVDVAMDALRERGVTHLVTVANHETSGLRELFEADPDLTVLYACREGEGVALACGLVAGGKRTVLCMENLGLFECLDTLRGLPYVMSIPLPVFVGYHGRGISLEDAHDQVGGLAGNMVSAGKWTEPVLTAAGVPYGVLLAQLGEEAARAIVEAALDEQGPYAVLVDNFDRES